MPWWIAWRAKWVALRAVGIPFGLMFVLHLVEASIMDLVQHVITSIGGSDVVAYNAAHVVAQAMYTAIDALLIAALLEMLLSGRKLADSLPQLVPSAGAIRFALAFLVIGIGTSLLHLALRHGLTGQATWTWVADDPLSPTALWLQLLFAPAIQWLVAGLAIAPLALRLLKLPALSHGDRPPKPWPPTIGLLGMLLAVACIFNLVVAVLQAILMPAVEATAPDGGAGGNRALSVIGESIVVLVTGYAGTFIQTLLIAASVAALLWRRRGSSANGAPGSTTAAIGS